MKFARVFTDILRTQLVLKTLYQVKSSMRLKILYIMILRQTITSTELKEGEIMRERLDILSQAESYVGKYFSDAYIQKHILHFSEDDIELE